MLIRKVIMGPSLQSRTSPFTVRCPCLFADLLLLSDHIRLKGCFKLHRHHCSSGEE